MLLNTHIEHLAKVMIKVYVLELLICDHALHIDYVGLLVFINISKTLAIIFYFDFRLSFRNSLCVCQNPLMELLENIQFFLSFTLILSQMV